jgi:hypothetical protein
MHQQQQEPTPCSLLTFAVVLFVASMALFSDSIAKLAIFYCQERFGLPRIGFSV